MEPPSLKLVMLQGPRQGETLQFRPGIAIRIGRVARGNTLSIKDAGISSKHLSITTESGKWVLQDLDSSNGTLFDGNKIPPHTPFHLHDGATIKIGELTSILVNLLLPEATDNPNLPGRPGTLSDAPVPKQRPGRAAKDKCLTVIANEGNQPGYVGQPAGTRVTRSCKNKQNAIEVSDSCGENLVTVVEKVPEPKKAREKGNLKIEPSEIAISDAPKEVEEPKNTRVTRTRNSKNKGPQNSNVEGGVENAEPKRKRGGGRRKKLQEECDKVAELEESKVDEVELNRDGGQGCSPQEEKLNGDRNWPDLEKLNLGQWFDFLEVQLPKQIIDATEEMIDSMREKAERLRQYIIQQKSNDKGKVPVE